MADVVWVARHGNRQDFVDPDWPKTAERPYDPGLSEDGHVQAKQLAERLENERIDCLFASPFLRTMQTANYVAEILDVPILVEPGIAEWMNPAWFPYFPEPHSVEELAERFPRIDVSYRSYGRLKYPETETDALRRAGDTARAVAERFGTSVLMVGHGVSVAGVVIGLAPAAEVLECGLCSLFKVVRESGRWHMALCDDMSHLTETGPVGRLN